MTRLYSALTAIVLAFMLLPSLPVSATAALVSQGEVLSPGLHVIAASAEMTVSMPQGGEAVFTAEDFNRATGSDVGYITVVSRPDSSHGQLVIGSIVVPDGQNITASNISRMSYMPLTVTGSTKKDTEAAFTFSVDGSGYVYTCRIVTCDADNAQPTVDCATAAALKARAYTGRAYAGVLGGSDPDGDALVFELVSYPRHGSVRLTDAATGRYVYTPSSGYTGRDSFSYTVRDCYGKYAADNATVSVSVSRGTGVDFSDMDGSAESAALTVTAAGLMSGTQVGNGYYFYPAQTVSRVEFLVTVMSAAGIDNLPATDKTVFDDDEDIARSMKAYVAAAYELGYTDGWIVNGKQCFLPDEPITAAEAAVITAAVLDIPVSDALAASAGGAAPAWARGAVATLAAGGLPVLADGGLGAGTKLTRGSAAELLSAVMRCAE